MRVGRAQLVLISITLVLAVTAILYFVFKSWSRRMASYDPAYEAITIGDSREAVVHTMGKPNAVTDCSNTPFPDEKSEAAFRSKCFQEYEYVEFMARYTISFDRNGAVIYKSKAVSP